MNRPSVCAKCCAALLPYFSVGKLEFSVLNHNFDLSIKDISYDKYFFLSKLSKCTAILCKKDVFLVEFNALSLPKNKCKIDEFLNDVKRLPDVIAISETKLHSNSVLNMHIFDHKLLRIDSNTCAGRVCLLIIPFIPLLIRHAPLRPMSRQENRLSDKS